MKNDDIKCPWCGCEGHIGCGEGVACAHALKKKSRHYENAWILSETILNAVGMALDGEKVSDFEESFPIVRKAQDVYWHSQK